MRNAQVRLATQRLVSSTQKTSMSRSGASKYKLDHPQTPNIPPHYLYHNTISLTTMDHDTMTDDPFPPLIPPGRNRRSKQPSPESPPTPVAGARNALQALSTTTPKKRVLGPVGFAKMALFHDNDGEDDPRAIAPSHRLGLGRGAPAVVAKRVKRVKRDKPENPSEADFTGFQHFFPGGKRPSYHPFVILERDPDIDPAVSDSEMSDPADDPNSNYHDTEWLSQPPCKQRLQVAMSFPSLDSINQNSSNATKKNSKKRAALPVQVSFLTASDLNHDGFMANRPNETSGAGFSQPLPMRRRPRTSSSGSSNVPLLKSRATTRGLPANKMTGKQVAEMQRKRLTAPIKKKMRRVDGVLGKRKRKGSESEEEMDSETEEDSWDDDDSDSGMDDTESEKESDEDVDIDESE
ncbi:hypothetical protein G7Y89_g11748 [Cudoniella acicularis]|uniref:Uncharacterized protein n=1 Tax=Cudoniella acicularis TaxID=354080 RepID=A0A8H4RCP8_9HELO|nr:hypothetical protein G7Y89_g11748 [Cudoniella acicularis]